MRVLEEAHVEHIVGIARQAAGEAERHDVERGAALPVAKRCGSAAGARSNRCRWCR
jgi:hypothetical protein